MAELLGVVAGGAGLLSLAGQLLEATEKLRRFCQTFKDADRRVRRLVGEVETLSVQLRMMEHDRVRYHSGDTEVIARCIQMCQVSTNEISWTTDRLVAISASSSTRGKFAAAFKDRELRELFDDLESSKSTLLLAWPYYTECRRRNDVALQQNAMATLQSMIQQSPPQSASLMQATNLQTGRTADLDLNFLPSPASTVGLSLRVGDDTTLTRHAGCNSKRRGRKMLLRIDLPKWLTDSSWYFALHSSAGRWTACLQAVNIVPAESEIFLACEAGQLNKVQELLRSGQASIHDETSAGLTPLECAAFAQNTNLCRFLLAQGQIANQWTVAYKVLGVGFDLDQRNSYRYIVDDNDSSVAALLVDEICKDDSFLGTTEWWARDWVFTQVVAPSLISTTKTYMQRNFSRMSVQDRMAFAMRVGPTRWNPRDFMAMAEITDHDLQTSDLVLAEVEEYACQGYLESSIDRAERWLDFAEKLSKYGTMPGRPHNRSTLRGILRSMRVPHEGYYRRSPEIIRVFQWLQRLLERGTDLCEYGASERAQWIDNERLGLAMNPGYVADFVYGPKPADWRIVFNSWQSLHLRRLQSMPGLWPRHHSVPDVIFWRPSQREELEGCWETCDKTPPLLRHVTVDIIEKMDEGSGFNDIELQAYAQDDARPVALLAHQRPRPTRSASQERYHNGRYLTQAEAWPPWWIPSQHVCIVNGRREFWGECDAILEDHRCTSLGPHEWQSTMYDHISTILKWCARRRDAGMTYLEGPYPDRRELYHAAF